MESIVAESIVLSDVHTSSLALWKPLEPLPLVPDVGGGTSALSQLLEVLRSNPESVAQRLRPSLCVVTCFDNESLRDEHLHLIVQAPIFRDGGLAKKRKRNLVGDIADFRDGEDQYLFTLFVSDVKFSPSRGC